MAITSAPDLPVGHIVLAIGLGLTTFGGHTETFSHATCAFSRIWDYIIVIVVFWGPSLYHSQTETGLGSCSVSDLSSCRQN